MSEAHQISELQTDQIQVWEIIDLPEKDWEIVEGIKFAKLNKNDTLKRYQREVYDEGKYHVHTVVVERIIKVHLMGWLQITNTFLDK